MDPQESICSACGRPMIEPECVDCGRTFPISKADRAFHIGRFGELPKRCPTCREYKRQYREHIERIE